jgi:hypothetical protein
MIYRWTQEQWEQRFGKKYWTTGLTSLMGNDRTEQESKILAVEWALDSLDDDDDHYDPYMDWIEEEQEAMRGEP